MSVDRREPDPIRIMMFLGACLLAHSGLTAEQAVAKAAKVWEQSKEVAERIDDET